MSTMKHYHRVKDLLTRIRYKDNATFRALLKNNMTFVQHQQEIACTKTGDLTWQGGRKFVISEHATDEEVLRTCYLAVKLFEEHEINETFLVDGERFLNPHPEGARADLRAVV